MVLICSAPWSHALTIGKTRGAAWINQTLDISVPLELDADQRTTDLCAQVELFYGDTRQDAGLVRVTQDAAAHPDSIALHIRSTSRVDEPVVTLNLRLGCDQPTVHRIVLLADYPNTITKTNTNTSATDSAAHPTPRPRLPAVNSEGIELTLSPSMSFDSLKLSSQSRKKKLHSITSDKPRKARLKLDPIETLATTNASPPRSAEVQQLEALQIDLKSLIDQAAKNELAMAAMRARLERSESDRTPLVLFYSLLALLALTLLGAVLLWARRQRRHP